MNTHSNSSTDARKVALLDWLKTLQSKHNLVLDTLDTASSDASFRRYYRLQAGSGTVIAMDAPPQQEDSGQFIHITGLLRQADLTVPTILEHDLGQGFLLVSDLGRQNYWHAIQQGLPDDTLQSLYRDAIQVLVQMQHADASSLPAFDEALLRDELTFFTEWYLQRYKQVTLSDEDQLMLAQTFQTLATHLARSPRVLVHRDFHSPNLMIGPEPSSGRQPGVIDYQDALSGPISYDIASLVMDARTTWEEDQQLDWAIRYWQAARDAGLPVNPDFAEFHIEYEWMSLQRNLRILGVFSRLSLRDGKHHYLDHLPRVNAYIRQVARRYAPFARLLRLLDRVDDTPITTGYTF